jgi:hypothetical protein
MSLSATSATGTGGGVAEVVVRKHRGPDGRMIFEIVGEIVVSGRVQKPTAFYVLDRASIGWKPEDLRGNFIPRILRSVENPPF